MSDLSVLWHEYERYEDLTREVTADVTTLKRSRFRLPGSQELTDDQRDASRHRLESLVQAVGNALASPVGFSLAGETTGLRIPSALIEQIRHTHGGMLPRYAGEVHALRQHLAQGEQHLTPRDIELLDDLSNSVHVETSRVFRRLYRK